MKKKNIITKKSLNFLESYINNFKEWLGDEFTICDYFFSKYNFHALVIVLKKNQRVCQ